MSLSDDSDDSSTDSSQPAAKRPRTDTHGASSTTYGSALQESDDEESPAATTQTYGGSGARARLVNYTEGALDEARRSHSSVSEICSSPSDDFRPTNDGESDWPPKAAFGDDKFYDKSSDEGSGGRPTMETNNYANQAAMRMMDKMGYTKGKGLGKYEHGRTEPVEASTQKGRRGLGLKPSTLGNIPADFKWTPDDSKPEAKEKVKWMPKPPDEDLSADQLEEWLQKGPKKKTIDDETHFCDETILQGVLGAKNIFDTLDAEDLRKARFRSNPYETIGALFFLNRAAVKMANMDAVFGFMFTNPMDPNGKNFVHKDGLLYFADVCAGPGGFSEYVLYRRKWKAKGFGFTLKGSNDFKLSDFYAGPPESFCPYYGVEDDGDIYNPDNLTSLRDHVIRQTDDKGVHFLMADGGFSVAGEENIQEILSKQLYLCQCLAALMLVRTGGHFVVKLFDIFTPFSVSLVYLMYRCFMKVTIFKPVTSRPANSERYLVCAWKRGNADCVERHLFEVNKYLFSRSERDDDVTSLVPLSVLKADTDFYSYIYNSNCTLGDRQIKNLLKIGQFCKDKNLEESSQAEMKKHCLKLWSLPDEVRTKPQRMSPDDTLSAIISLMKKSPPEANDLHAFKSKILGKSPHIMEAASDVKRFRSIYDWHYQFLLSGRDNNECTFFLGAGGNQVYQLKGTLWQKVAHLQLAMPAKTLLYGEVVRELCGVGGTQTHTKALHIIDAVCLGGTDISYLSLTDRLRQCEIFCTALSKPYDHQVMAIRCKKLFKLEHFPRDINNLTFRQLKIGPTALTVDVPSRLNREHRFHVVGSLIFFKEVKEPWESSLSRSDGTKYYFKVTNGAISSKSIHEFLPEAWMDVLGSWDSRIVWHWEPPSVVFKGDEHKGLKRKELEEYVRKKAVHR